MKNLTYLMVVCAVSLLVGRSDAKEPSSEIRNPSSSRDDITVQGCVARSTGYYILIRTEPGNTYNLEEGSRTIKLGSYLGEQVEVTGWESPQLSNSSSVFYSTAPSAVTVMVTSIKTLAERCTEGEISASADSSLVSGAELDLSSTPPDAEIEIDGNFVGHTTSIVGVSAGDHQVIVKKRGYQPWKKRMVVTSGRIRIHADLEAESK
jgi:PEGA domain